MQPLKNRYCSDFQGLIFFESGVYGTSVEPTIGFFQAHTSLERDCRLGL